MQEEGNKSNLVKGTFFKADGKKVFANKDVYEGPIIRGEPEGKG